MRIPRMGDFLAARRFFERVRAGERGVDGSHFALRWGEHTVIGVILLVRKPMLQMGLLEDARTWPAELSLIGLGG